MLVNRALPGEIQALARATGAEAIAFGDGAAGAADDDLWRLLAGFPASPCERRVGTPRDIGVIDYTSGSTATPKGVCITHEAFFYMCKTTRGKVAREALEAFWRERRDGAAAGRAR